MRVTVVATGLGEERPVAVPQPEVEIAPVRLVGKEPVEQEELDYNSLEVPTNIRRNPKPAAGYGGQTKETDDMEYLDIPAFLRRQAD
jgi:cell division protein FtsZ